MLKIKQLSFYLFAVLLLSFPCYGEVNRKDVISYNLDYYDIQEESRKETIIQKETRTVLKQEKDSENKERRRKIKDFLKKIEENTIIRVTGYGTFNDNVYNTHSNPEADFITGLDIGFSYRPDWIWEKGHTVLDFNFEGGPRVSLGNSGSDSGANIMFEGSLSHTRGKYKGEIVAGIESDSSPATSYTRGGAAENVDSLESVYGGGFYADWEYLPFDLEYRYYTKTFESSESTGDSERSSLSFTEYLRIFSKMKVLLNYKYEEEMYPSNSAKDASTHGLAFGVTGNLSPKVEGTIKVGAKTREKANGTEADGSTVDVKLLYLFTENLYYDLKLSKDVTPSDYFDEDYNQTNSFSLNCTYLPPFSERLKFTGKVSFADSEASSNITSQTYSFGLGSEYAMKRWLKVIAEYAFTKKESDDELSSYTNNILSLRLVREF
ncbi:MAG: outer membrane beta-barrel protein [Candidatus Omnitrophica bacterium]|nr:outer membrane beta-barrel protein [Candidatus Omnitrophota bacterium]